MISANDPPKYKVARSPLSMGREKTLRASEGHFSQERRGEDPTAQQQHSLSLHPSRPETLGAVVTILGQTPRHQDRLVVVKFICA